tara:strand:+ start:252 stop:899 length:648 start_codon:yes stop_codon:yes gene_type:complete
MKKALVLAGSRGIGKAIATSLKNIKFDVNALSSNDLDTSNIPAMEKFSKSSDKYDVLVLNTGGPPAMDFDNITKDDCMKYHNQLFYGFFLLLQNLKLNNNAYVFLISSFNVKEPDPKLILSNAYRIAFISVFKSLSKQFAKRNITMINIAPGPIDTDRLRELNDDFDSLEASLPLGRVAKPEEIGNFVSAIITSNTKYMTGVTINFDGGISNYVL